MNIYLKVYPAKNGDCFLISFGEENATHKHLLIDCGYADTVTNYLKKDLVSIGKKGEVLEKFILTHIDADHIQGAIKFLKENNLEKFIHIKEVWLNTFRHLFDKEDNKTDKNQERILKNIIRRGYPEDNSTNKTGRQISAQQGTTVGALVLQGKYSWNNDFFNFAVCIENKQEIGIDQDASIFLLSPDKEKLEKLKSLWKEELKKYGVNYSFSDFESYDDAFEMLALWEKERSNTKPKEISVATQTVQALLKRSFDEDDTATNGSSVAFILHIQDKKLLFLGDAHPDLIVKSLNEYSKSVIVIFDLIKVSHHGSFGNISKELLNKIDSKRFLISTNGGKHNHPDKETIAHIISRDVDFHRELYFNYTTDNSRFFEREDWMIEYNYSIHYLNEADYTLPL